MYHLDDAPIEYMNPLADNGCGVENYHGFSYSGNVIPDNCIYESFQKFNETFLFGFDYSFILPGSLDMYPYAFLKNNQWHRQLIEKSCQSLFQMILMH